jgi:hypothetical protein
MKEATRYLENARKTLRQSPVVGGRYADVKYVKSACGTAYLAVLKAIDDYLLTKGIVSLRKELPKSVEAYRLALQRNLSRYNGKLLGEFDTIYDELHIAGYYRGLLTSKEVVLGAFDTAEHFIERVSSLT